MQLFQALKETDYRKKTSFWYLFSKKRKLGYLPDSMITLFVFLMKQHFLIREELTLIIMLENSN